MTTAMGGHLFAEVVLAPAVLRRKPIQADVDRVHSSELFAPIIAEEKQMIASFG